MCPGLGDPWGSGGGAIVGLAPQIRLLAGALLFAACLVAPSDSASGAGFLVVTVVGWLLACAVPLRILRAALLFGLALFLPVFLLAPLLPQGSGPAVLWSVVAKGLSGLLVSLGTVAAIPAADLDEGLARLPLPGAFALLVSQILRQTGTLADETRRISQAVALRAGAAGSRQAWRVLASFPRVWLSRVVARADRVADAMELRGFGPCVPRFRDFPLGRGDLLAVFVAIAWLGIAVALRAWGAP
jgi:energy-coupling factor transporter transmembrane protein EcfT